MLDTPMSPVVDPAAGANLVGHLIRRCQQRAVDLFTRSVGPDGLTHQQFILLLAVDENPSMTQTGLVHATGIDRSTLTDMIGRLSDRGYLKRKTATYDRRANEITITAKGRRVLQAAMPAAIAADRTFVEALPAGKRTAFIECLMVLARLDEPPVVTAAPGRRRSRSA